MVKAEWGLRTLGYNSPVVYLQWWDTSSLVPRPSPSFLSLQGSTGDKANYSLPHSSTSVTLLVLCLHSHNMWFIIIYSTGNSFHHIIQICNKVGQTESTVYCHRPHLFFDFHYKFQVSKSVCDVCHSFDSYVRLQVEDSHRDLKFYNMLIWNLNNDHPPACKIEKVVTINYEFSLPHLIINTLWKHLSAWKTMHGKSSKLKSCKHDGVHILCNIVRR